MKRKQEFEMPTIVTYQRDELIVETAFTGTAISHLNNVSDRAVKEGFAPVDTREVLRRLTRLV